MHINFIYTYLLTPWCRVLLEKLNGLQLVKKFPAFHGTRRFITALTSVRHLSLSWASPIQSIYTHPTSWRSILILSTHLCLGLPSGLFPSGFPTKTLYTPPLLTHTCHMPSPSHFYLRYQTWTNTFLYNIYFIYIIQKSTCSGLISQTSHAAVNTIFFFCDQPDDGYLLAKICSCVWTDFIIHLVIL